MIDGEIRTHEEGQYQPAHRQKIIKSTVEKDHSMVRHNLTTRHSCTAGVPVPPLTVARMADVSETVKGGCLIREQHDTEAVEEASQSRDSGSMSQTVRKCHVEGCAIVWY